MSVLLRCADHGETRSKDPRIGEPMPGNQDVDTYIKHGYYGYELRYRATHDGLSPTSEHFHCLQVAARRRRWLRRLFIWIVELFT